MFPDDFGTFPKVSRAFRSCESLEKSESLLNKFADQFVFCEKIQYWESFEMGFAEVSGGLELILRGKRSFEVWHAAVCDVKIRSRRGRDEIEVRSRRGRGEPSILASSSMPVVLDF